MTDLEFIKKFSKITIKKVCEENGVKPNNLWTGSISKNKLSIIRKAIEAEVGNIYVEEYQSM